MAMRGGGLVLTVCVGMLGWTGVRAQLADDFSSGFFSSSGWKGDTTHFRITSSSAIPPSQQPALQLYRTESGTSLIYATDIKREQMEWQAWCKLSFNPSSANFARLYLAAGPGFPGQMDQSIFVGIGMSNDRVGLYQHQGSQITTLITDTITLLNQSTNQVRIQVIRKNPWWYLATDPAGGTDLLILDSVMHAVSFDTALAGIFCQYTSSNATKVYFDDIYCGPLQIDTVPPELLACQVRSGSEVSLTFSEALHPGVMGNPGHFAISHGVGPLILFTDPTVPSLVHLVFSGHLPEGVAVTLSLHQLTDKAGNPMPDTQLVLVWYTAARNDLLINEIMADPTPVVKLPESEYIELYNRSGHVISLCDWALWTDQTRISLPCTSAAPGGYLILVNEKELTLWNGVNGVVPVTGLQLRNDGACVTLQDHLGRYIHAVSFSPAWHSTTFQAEGGYSLEMKDPTNPCDPYQTWGSSLEMAGGTPGYRNSYTSPHPDVRAPTPLRVSFVDPCNIRVTYSEPVDTLKDFTILCVVEGHPGRIARATLKAPMYDQVTLTLSPPLHTDTVYYLVQADTLRDCAGNQTLASRLPFGIPSLPDTLDLLFNEVMYKPADYGVEYLEFLNPSKKIIDLSSCLLARIDTLDGTVKELFPLTDEPALVFPGTYTVITADPQKLLSFHHRADPQYVFRNSAMPSLSDQGDTYALITRNGKIVDRLSYDPSFHAPAVSDARGIALERVSALLPTEQKDNWFSASAASGWGTPTQPNSQSFQLGFSTATVLVQPGHFSPYGGSSSASTFITLSGLATGTMATIIIHDEPGRAVRRLVQETVTGNGEVWRWDGDDDHGRICNGGVYLVTVHLNHAQEGTRTIRKTVVLISR